MEKDFRLALFFFPPLWFFRRRGGWPEEDGGPAGVVDLELGAPGSG
jgi:hypothetical protein